MQKQRQTPPTAEELDPEAACTSQRQNIEKLKTGEYSGRPASQHSDSTKVWPLGSSSPTAEEKLNPEVVAHTSPPQNIAKLNNCEFAGPRSVFDRSGSGALSRPTAEELVEAAIPKTLQSGSIGNTQVARSSHAAGEPTNRSRARPRGPKHIAKCEEL